MSKRTLQTAAEISARLADLGREISDVAGFVKSYSTPDIRFALRKDKSGITATLVEGGSINQAFATAISAAIYLTVDITLKLSEVGSKYFDGQKEVIIPNWGRPNAIIAHTRFGAPLDATNTADTTHKITPQHLTFARGFIDVAAQLETLHYRMKAVEIAARHYLLPKAIVKRETTGMLWWKKESAKVETVPNELATEDIREILVAENKDIQEDKTQLVYFINTLIGYGLQHGIADGAGPLAFTTAMQDILSMRSESLAYAIAHFDPETDIQRLSNDVWDNVFDWQYDQTNLKRREILWSQDEAKGDDRTISRLHIPCELRDTLKRIQKRNGVVLRPREALRSRLTGFGEEICQRSALDLRYNDLMATAFNLTAACVRDVPTIEAIGKRIAAAPAPAPSA